VRRKTVNAKKERELLVAGLKNLLRKESKIVEEYRALAEMFEGIPVSLLLDWVIIEEEAHHTILINIIHSLKQTARKGSETDADGLETERETMMCWVKRLRMKEQTVVAVCRSLKSQACWENGNVVDAFLDALIMDSEKHQRFLLAVEKTVDNLIMSRPQ
jgi:rubrerythrin